MMNFCPNCGMKLGKDCRFCPNCGKELRHYEGTPAPQRKPPEARQQEIRQQEIHQQKTWQQETQQQETQQQNNTSNNSAQEYAPQKESIHEAVARAENEIGKEFENVESFLERNITPIRLVSGILGIICLIATIPGLFNVIRGFIASLPYLFSWNGSYVAFYVLSVALNVFSAIAIILFAITTGLIAKEFKLGEENLYFAALSAEAVLSIVLIFIDLIFTKIRNPYVQFYYILQGSGKGILGGICIAGIMFVVFTVFAERPFKDYDSNRIKETYMDMLDFLFNKIKGLLSDLPEKENKRSTVTMQNDKREEYRNGMEGAHPGYGADRYQGQAIPRNMRTYRDSTDLPPTTGGTPLKTNRAMWKWVVFTFLTCGLYAFYYIYALARDINICCDGDGESTSGLIKYIILSFLTCGIYAFYWHYKIGNRMWTNAFRYNLRFSENGSSVLLWQLFGVFLCGIGPFISLHIVAKNANALCLAYNQQVLGRPV